MSRRLVSIRRRATISGAISQKLNNERGLTVFFTTHYMEEAERIAQRIAIVDHGKIVAMGTPTI